MKRIIILFFTFSLFFIVSCQKENTNDVSEFADEVSVFNRFVNPLIKEFEKATKGVNTSDNGYIVLKFDEYVDNLGIHNKVNTTFAAGFKSKGNMIDAGNVSINGYSLNKLGNNRLLLYTDVNKKTFLGRNVVASFKSQGSLFSDFDQTIYVPKEFDVKSNIAGQRYFDKTKDLQLTWKPDIGGNSVVLGICVQGSPCIVKVLPDNGSVTIPNHEFKGFKRNSHVSIQLARGKLTCRKDDVCVVAFNNAKMTGRIVQ